MMLVQPRSIESPRGEVTPNLNDRGGPSPMQNMNKCLAIDFLMNYFCLSKLIGTTNDNRSGRLESLVWMDELRGTDHNPPSV